jgi:eukaryotic-like serine/threonine-protein kinase
MRRRARRGGATFRVVADDKKTQLGTLDPSRSGSVPVAASLPSLHGSEALAAAPQVPPLATPAPSVAATMATASQPVVMPTPGTGEDPLLGRTLARRYTILKKLGEGGMGSVYLASHVALEKQVALKILHGEFARKPDLVERFMQEAKAASRIRHENVIDISDFGVTEEGLVFFAMELLSGSDLHELIARARLDGEVLPWARSREIFLQVCAALAAAHSHRIVHRDLKPENIYLIDFLGKPDFVKLLDFGIAKLAESDQGERKLTRTGMLFGTPEYMSPEQARGDKHIDHRVDIYAMACILFQLLTGSVPFAAENFMGVLSLHLTEPPPEIPPATLARSGAPPAIAAIVAKGLAKFPDQRWQTIEEMAAAVAALRPDEAAPVATAAPASGRTRTRWTGKLAIPIAEPAARRSAWLPWSLGAVAVASLAVAVLVLWQREAAAPAPAPAAPAAGLASPPAAPEATPAVAPRPAAPPEEVDSPPTVVPPAPLPATVTVTFKLAKGVVLLAPDGARVGDARGRAKVVQVQLPGSETEVTYVARGKGKVERPIRVVPDRDAELEVAFEAERAPRGSVTAAAAGGDAPATAPDGAPAEAAAPELRPDAAPAAPSGDEDPGAIELKPFDHGAAASEAK